MTATTLEHLPIGLAISALKTIRTWFESRRGVKILLAEWGPGPRNGDYEDVTLTVAGYVKDGEIKMRASDANLGDPYPGKEKHLRVHYKLRGKMKQASVGHNDWLRLPADRS